MSDGSVFFDSTIDPGKITAQLRLMDQAPHRPAPNVLYGIACVAAERAAVAVAKSPEPIFWQTLLAALKSPGAWEWSEPMFEEIRRSTEDALKLNGLLMRGTCNLPLARFAAVGARGARALARDGLLSPGLLLLHAATPADRTALSKRTGIDADELERWARLAELAVVLDQAHGAADNDLFEQRYLGDLVTLAGLATITDVRAMAGAHEPAVPEAMKRANDERMRIPAHTAKKLSQIVKSWKNASADWPKQLDGKRDSLVQPSPEQAEDAGSTAADSKARAADSST